MHLASIAKAALGPRWTTRARCVIRGLPVPRWGNFRRLQPFSSYYGFDRGTPIDRYYLAQFLDAHRGDITGDVLEVQVSGTGHRFGHALRKVDTIDIEDRFNPTYCCDLACSEGIVPGSAYDCFLLPNTLSFLRDLEGCLCQALRIVRPRGVILATTAVMGQLNGDGADYWRMTTEGWKEIADRAWPGCDVTITSYGNCLSATAALMGLVVEEITRDELDVFDPKFPVLVGLRCQKPGL